VNVPQTGTNHSILHYTTLPAEMQSVFRWRTQFLPIAGGFSWGAPEDTGKDGRKKLQLVKKVVSPLL